MTTDTETSDRPGRSILIGPSEPAGVVLGQSAGQLAVIVVMLGLLLRVLDPGTSWIARMVLAALIVLLGVAGWLPVHLGRPPLHWARLWTAMRLQRLSGHDHYLGGPFRSRPEDIDIPGAQLPGLLGATRWLEFATGPTSPPIGIWHDTREHTYTAVLAVEGSTFHMLELAEQDRREAAYGRMLAALCDPARHIKRLQILERTVPDSGDALQRDLAARAAPIGSPAAVDSYREVLAQAGPSGQRHETYIAACIDAVAAARDIARAGGGDQGAAGVLDREVRRLSAELANAGVRVHGYAPPRRLAYLLRTAFDPHAAGRIDERGGADSDIPGGAPGLPSGVDPRQAGPAHAQSLWNAYRTDSAWHRGYWVAEWPRKAAPSAFLTPLLLFCRHRRVISLIFEPRPVRTSVRQIEKRADRQDGEAGLRAWLRLRRRKRSAVVRTHLERREDALLSGEALLALRAFVVVTGADLEELDDTENEILDLAQQSQIELQPMYGAHDQAFAVAAVPMARSL